MTLFTAAFLGFSGARARPARALRWSRSCARPGSGGGGKTRLALQVASHVLDWFADGVCLVELAALSDPSLVVQAVAQALDVRESPNAPLADTLIQQLQSKSLLLILDNCEHLLDACARFAHDLLPSARDVKILATSRQALGVADEQRWTVPPLSLADERAAFAELAESDAVQLFVERASAMLPQFRLTSENAHTVAQLCRQLDALPLAIGWLPRA